MGGLIRSPYVTLVTVQVEHIWPGITSLISFSFQGVFQAMSPLEASIGILSIFQ